MVLVARSCVPTPVIFVLFYSFSIERMPMCPVCFCSRALVTSCKWLCTYDLYLAVWTWRCKGCILIKMSCATQCFSCENSFKGMCKMCKSWLCQSVETVLLLFLYNDIKKGIIYQTFCNRIAMEYFKIYMGLSDIFRV